MTGLLFQVDLPCKNIQFPTKMLTRVSDLPQTSNPELRTMFPWLLNSLSLSLSVQLFSLTFPCNMRFVTLITFYFSFHVFFSRFHFPSLLLLTFLFIEIPANSSVFCFLVVFSHVCLYVYLLVGWKTKHFKRSIPLSLNNIVIAF